MHQLQYLDDVRASNYCKRRNNGSRPFIPPLLEIYKKASRDYFAPLLGLWKMASKSVVNRNRHHAIRSTVLTVS